MAVSETQPSADPAGGEAAIREHYDFDADRAPVRAVDTMPDWGKALAWTVWRCPWIVFLVAVNVTVWGAFTWQGWLGYVALLQVVYTLFCVVGRWRVPDPFTNAVLVARYPVPQEVVDQVRRELDAEAARRRKPGKRSA